MEKALGLLAEINIDEEFRIVVLKVSHNIKVLFTRVNKETDETVRQQLLDYADYLLDLIANCYEDNEDYQNLMRFMRGEIDDRRYLLKKNSSNQEELSKDEKPIIH